MEKYLHFIFACFVIFFTGCGTGFDPLSTKDLSYPQIIIFDDINSVDISNDAVSINEVSVDNDTLKLNVSYSGGCKEHEFKLFGSSNIAESNPPQAQIFLSHNANNDACEAYITEELAFDLSPLKDSYKQIFQDNGPLLLRIYAPRSSDPVRPLPVYSF